LSWNCFCSRTIIKILNLFELKFFCIQFWLKIFKNFFFHFFWNNIYNSPPLSLYSLSLTHSFFLSLCLSVYISPFFLSLYLFGSFSSFSVYVSSFLSLSVSLSVFSLSLAQFHQRSTYSFYVCRFRMRKKRQSSQQCHLALLGPTSVKAARKMLVKLTLCL